MARYDLCSGMLVGMFLLVMGRPMRRRHVAQSRAAMGPTHGALKF